MEWWLLLPIIIGSLLVLMALGLPVALCFLLINAVGMFMLMGGTTGLSHLSYSLFSSISRYSFSPLILFILMGEVMFQSKIGPQLVDALDKWLGRLPGRLGLLAVGTGALFATLTGTAMGSVAMLGKALVPEMEKRGYKKPMSLGPILGSGGLAIMIPPSGLAIILSVIAELSIGKMLMAIILPGVLMAILYAAYIIIRCWVQPSIAIPYEVKPTPLSDKLLFTAKYVLPVGVIIFLVIGVIFLGIATPTEAAACGAIGMFGLAAAYKQLNWGMVKKSLANTIYTSGMVLLIMGMAKSYSEIIAFSGTSQGLIAFSLGLPVAPIILVIAMVAVMLFLGMFISQTPIMLIVIPLYLPIIYALGLDPIWFGVLTLLSMEMATTSPPFGLSLYVMKGVAPPDTTLGDCNRAALPFLGADLVAMALIMAFPAIALWLPGVMR